MWPTPLRGWPVAVAAVLLGAALLATADPAVVQAVMAMAKASDDQQLPQIKREVWHHAQTIGVIGFNPADNTMRSCDLILAEKSAAQKQNILSRLFASGLEVREVDFDTMLSVVTSCEVLDELSRATAGYPRRARPDNASLNMFTLMKGIVPGTKWCGYDDIAAHYHDLGDSVALDKCCRAHDHCPVKIKAFATNYGARNSHPYTKSHCACDDMFYSCLKRTRDRKADAIGNIFFNVVALQCAEPLPAKPACATQTQFKRAADASVLFDKMLSAVGMKGQNESYGFDRGDCAYQDAAPKYPDLHFRDPKANY